MNLNHLKVKHENSSLEEMFDGTIGKFIGSDYTIELKEDTKPYYESQERS